MKRLVLILIPAILFVLSILPLSAKLSDLDKQTVDQEINTIIQKNALVFEEKINVDQFRQRNQVRILIKKAINEGNSQLYNDFALYYYTVLDTLSITNPASAKELVKNLTTLYQAIPDAVEPLSFYDSKSDYYLGLYQKVGTQLSAYVDKFQQSPRLSQAITLLLKSTLISDGVDNVSSLLSKYESTFNDEQNYLAGQICFMNENDAEAKKYFSRVKGSNYSNDATQMLELIQILQDQPETALHRIEALQKAGKTNPFISLTAARLNCMMGQWENAEENYTDYLSAQKSLREFQATYELATTYLNLNRPDKALETLNSALEDKKQSQYVSPLMILWAEITAKQGRIKEASTRNTELYEYANQNQKLLEEKSVLINNLVNQVTNLDDKPNLQQVITMLDNLHTITGLLGNINAKIITNPAGVDLDLLESGVLIENQMIGSITNHIRNFIYADKLKNIPDTLHTRQLSELERIYAEQLKRIAVIKMAAIDLGNKNTYLAIRNEIDNNIEVLDKILQNVYSLKASGQNRYNGAQLDSLIAANERKKVELTLLKDYYNYDNSEYKSIISEIEMSDQETNLLIDNLQITKSELKTKFPLLISQKEKKNVIKDLKSLSLLIPEYRELIVWQKQYLDGVKSDLEYSDINIGFIESDYYDQQRLLAEKSLSFEENQKLYIENRIRKQSVYNKASVFVSRFSAKELKNDTETAVNTNVLANACFIIAETGSALWPEQIDQNLTNYQKILKTDPDFYLADAILYNIAYLSSLKISNEIEQYILTYQESSASSLPKPESAQHTEVKYAEPIALYNRIIREFPHSQYYSEAIYRLGYIYYEIGTDADQPVNYYTKAREYYDRLLVDTANPYYYKALYQRGWTWLSSSDVVSYKKGIDDYVTILNAIEQDKIAAEPERTDYAITSVKNISYCLVGLDTSMPRYMTEGADYVLNVLAKKLTKNDLSSILEETANNKMKLFLPIHAAEYLKAKISLDPLALDNPFIADSICTLYRQYSSQLKTGVSPDSLYYAEKEGIVRQYGFDSDWYRQNRKKDIEKQLLVVMSALLESEKYYNNRFVDNPTYDNFAKYAELSSEFEKFEQLQDSKYSILEIETQINVIAQNLQLASTTGDPLHYLALATRIYSFNDKHPQNSNFIDLEGTAYDCARIVVDSLQTDLIKLKAENKKLVIPLSNKNPELYMQEATERLAGFLLSDRFKSPKNDLVYLSIINRQAEIEQKNGKNELAVAYLQRIVDFVGYVPNETKRNALLDIADNYERKGDFSSAETWYRNAENYALDKNDKESIRQYYLLQIQNNIDKAETEGAFSLAGDEYLRLSAEYSAIDKTRSQQYR